MAEEKEPLHVQVARADGCDPYQPTDDPDESVVECWICPCRTRDHACRLEGDDHECNVSNEVRDFTKDGWAEILERERYTLSYGAAANPDMNWIARPDRAPVSTWANGAAPGEAVCRLFVKMKGAKP